MGLGGWILENRFRDTGGGRAHQAFPRRFWKRPPGQTSSLRTTFLNNDLERCGIKKREGRTQERLYIPPSAEGHNHTHQAAPNLSEVKTTRSDHHCIIHPTINLSYTHTTLYAKNDVKEKKETPVNAHKPSYILHESIATKRQKRPLP